MKTSVAWHKFVHQPRRTAAALAGVCFALLLIFMQLGFYDSCFRSATLIFDQFDFDLVLVSPHYVFLVTPGTIPRTRLEQAQAVAGVARTTPLYVAVGEWRNVATGYQGETLVLGIDPRDPSLRRPDVQHMARQLQRKESAILDSRFRLPLEPVGAGTVAELNRRRIEVIDMYAHGTGFTTDALTMVGDLTFVQVFPNESLERVAIGLICLEPGVDAAVVQRELRRRLPEDTQVWTRAQLEAHEQNYFVHVKPIGIMFSSGVVLGFVVGAAVLYQILASEVNRHLRDYATLKALGYTGAATNRIVLEQGFLYAITGFVPAAVLAWLLYGLTRASQNLPMYMTWQRLAFVLALGVAMCSFSGWLAGRKVNRADPVELF